MYKYILLFFADSIISASNDYNYTIDSTKTIVWGPGLDPEKIVMRSRYFFLQLVDHHGHNVTQFIESVNVTAEISGKNVEGATCRIWRQIFDCKDGSFIIRYRLYETCYDFNLKIMINNQIISNGLIQVKGPVREEECICPSPSMDDWLRDYGCLFNYSQIYNDLEHFPSVNFDTLRNKLITYYNRPHSVSLCHYVIKDNEIFRKCYGEHTGFRIFSDAIWLSLARKVKLPDVEFFMNLGDWPLVSDSGPLFPIFSWCGSTDTRDIVLPTYDITESSLEAMGRITLDMLSVQGKIKTPWDKKIEKLFWRGRDSRRERLDLIDIARKNPDLFNVSITNFFFFKNEEAKYGPRVQPISFHDFFQYKYLLNIDGTVAAYRLPYLLAGDSVVFKQDSKYYEYFYSLLIPDVHYVPVEHNLSNLVEKTKWAKTHDDSVRQIARNGRVLMREIALPQNVFCYHASLIQIWSKRLVNHIKVLDGMEKVKQVSNSLCSCVKEANLNSNNKDEL